MQSLLTKYIYTSFSLVPIFGKHKYYPNLPPRIILMIQWNNACEMLNIETKTVDAGCLLLFLQGKRRGWYPVRILPIFLEEEHSHTLDFMTVKLDFTVIFEISFVWGGFFSPSHMGLSWSHYSSDTFFSLNMEEKNTLSAIFSGKRDSGGQAEKCLKSLQDLEGGLCQLMPFLQGWPGISNCLLPFYTGVSVKCIGGKSVKGKW